MLPWQIYPQKVDDGTLAHLERMILEVGDIVSHFPQQGVWKDKGLVANHHGWKWEAPDTVQIKQTLDQILFPIIGNYTCVVNYVLDSKLPWAVHNDYLTDSKPLDTEPYYAAMIPLETTAAKTIFFDQYAPYKHFHRFKEEHGPIPNHVPYEIWNNTLGHCHRQDRFYLSIHKIYDWQRGDLILFDRQQWHASDDYRSKIQNKRAIVLFTNKL